MEFGDVVFLSVAWVVASLFITAWVGDGYDFNGKLFWSMFLLGTSFFIYCGNGSNYCFIDTPACLKSVKENKEAAEKEAKAHEHFCEGSHLVSSINGVELYQTNCRINHGEYVYFSKSGTSTTHQECHSSGKHGSSCETKHDDTPNGS